MNKSKSRKRKRDGGTFNLPRTKKQKTGDDNTEECIDECINFLKTYTNKREADDELHRLIKKAERMRNTQNKKQKSLKELPSTLSDVKLESKNSKKIKSSNIKNKIKEEVDIGDIDGKIGAVLDENDQTSQKEEKITEREKLINKIRMNKTVKTSNIREKQIINCAGPDVSSLDKFMQYKHKASIVKNKATNNNNVDTSDRLGWKGERGSVRTKVLTNESLSAMNDEYGTPGPLESNWDSKLFNLYTEYLVYKKRRHDEINKNSLEENCCKYTPPNVSAKHIAKMLVKPQGRWFGRCSMGHQCEMRTLNYSESGNPFTGMIYHTPEEYDKVMKTGKKLLNRGFCYVCIVSATTLAWQKNNASNHRLEPLYPPFQHLHSQPGEYQRKYMIQHSMGYTDGILVPFRQFDVSQYRETFIPTILPDGKEIKLRGFQEKMEVFFVNSSMDSTIPLVNPRYYKTIKIKELTTEFILREIFSVKELARDYIERIFEHFRLIEFINNSYYHYIVGYDMFHDKKDKEGLLDNIFGKRPTGQTRNRGIKFDTPLPGEEIVKFSGLPFDYIFTEDISLTESKIVDLSTLFGFRKFDERRRLSYTYPVYTLHDSESQENRALHDEAHTNYKKYHALHIRVNVTLCILEMLFKKNNLTYYDGIEVFDHLSNPHSDKKDPKIANLVKIFSKMKDGDVRIFKKLDLFLKGHLKLIEVYCEKGILPDEWFDKVPDVTVFIPTETKEWRPYSVLYNPKAAMYFEKEDEKHIKYATKLHEKPSTDVEIRHFYDKKGINTSICFCEFKDTLKFIESMKDDEIKGLWSYCKEFPHWKPEFFEGFTKELFSSSNIKDYTIFITLLFRVNKSYSSIEALLSNITKAETYLFKLETDGINSLDTIDMIDTDKNDNIEEEISNLKTEIAEYREVVYNLRLFASTHIDLAIFICDTGCIINTELRTTLPGLECTSAYDVYYPETNRVFHEGDLPDLSNYYSYVNFISDNWVTNSDNEWFYLAAKTMPKCCQSRKWIQKHNSACLSNDAYVNWVISCLKVSLLGMYRECNRWPNFMDSVKITKYFNVMKKKENLQDFIQFQSDHSNVVMNALREYMFFVIKFNTPYLKVIKSYFTKWDQFEVLVKKKMDMVRHLYSEREENNSTLMDINKLVEDIFFDNRKVFRRNPSKFANFMHDRFKEINAELSKKRGRKKKNIDVDTETIMTYQRRPDKLSDLEITIVDDFVSRVDTKKDIVLNDLKYIGVSEGGIILLKCCYLQFLSREQNRSIVIQLKRLTVRDYELVYHFFDALRLSTSILAIQTDYKTKLLQEEAIRNKYGIKEDQEIPDAPRAIIFSQCCQDKKTFDAQTHGIRYYGHEKVSFDKDTQKFLCCGKKSKNNSKKRDKNKENTSKARTSRKKDKTRYNKKCKETEIIALPIVGHIVQFDNAREKPNPKSYTVCPNPKCGTVTEFGISMFGPNGFTCGVCDIDERNKYNYPECSGRCGKIGSKMRKWSSIYMLDDCDTENGPGTYTMKRYYFCADCSRKCIMTKLNKSRGVNITNNHHTQALSYKESLALLGNVVKTHDDFEKVLWSCSTNVKKYSKTTKQL